jgi:hypothetical protein
MLFDFKAVDAQFGNCVTRPIPKYENDARPENV